MNREEQIRLWMASFHTSREVAEKAHNLMNEEWALESTANGYLVDPQPLEGIPEISSVPAAPCCGAAEAEGFIEKMLDKMREHGDWCGVPAQLLPKEPNTLSFFHAAYLGHCIKKVTGTSLGTVYFLTNEFKASLTNQ